MENFGKFTLGLVLVLLGIVLRGYVLTKFWTWFIVSTFDVKPIALINAIGLSCFVSFLLVGLAPKDEKSFWEKMLELFIGLGFCLLMGWVISLFY